MRGKDIGNYLIGIISGSMATMSLASILVVGDWSSGLMLAAGFFSSLGMFIHAPVNS